jgi:hypothetical protein
MALSSQRFAANLRAAIKRECVQHRGKLDEQTRKLLKRLTDSPDATKALERLEKWCELKECASCWREIVTACIHAERLTRAFPKHIKEANETLHCLKQLYEGAFAQFGATRKTKIETAPRNAAIWAVAEAVKLCTGKPHYREVADLASVILKTEIDENIVKHAIEGRTKKFKAMQKKRAQRLLDMQTA